MSHDFLQHEAPDARAGVDRGEDEERLEHDREVIPQRGERLAPERRGQAGENVRDADRERRRATRARDQRLLAHLLRERLHVLGRHDEACLVQHVRRAG